jgi:hypothetical protein
MSRAQARGVETGFGGRAGCDRASGKHVNDFRLVVLATGFCIGKRRM